MSFSGSKAKNRLKGDLTKLMPSGEWAATHKGTAYAILAPLEKRVPTVTANGTGFYYRAWWPARKVMAKLIEFAGKNPECIPTMDDILQIVWDANNRCWRTEQEDQELLNVAAMEGRVSKRVISAVDGGVKHEALHKAFTCQRDLDAQEIYDIVIPRWAKIQKMSTYTKILLDAANIIEDIRIERLGCGKYPGIRTSMADLQDFILTMEAEGRDSEGAEQMDDAAKALMVIFGAFRDIGLGYRTQLQRDALVHYKATNEEAYNMVVEGPIADILRSVIPDCSSKDSIEAEAKNDLVSLEKAFDLIAIIDEEFGMPEQPQGGQGQSTGCPKCNAPASKLRARPVAGQPDKIAIVCTECGHMEIIDKPEEAEGGEGEGEGGTAIENPNQPESNDQSQGGGNQGDVIRWEDNEVDASDASDNEGEEDSDSEGSEGSEAGEGDEEEAEGSEGSEGAEGDSDEEGDEATAGEGDEEGAESDSEGDEAKGEGDEAGEGEDDAEGDSEASEGDADEGAEDADEEFQRTDSAEAGFSEGTNHTGEGAGATSGESEITLGDLINQALENGDGAGLMDYAEALGGKAEQAEEKAMEDLRAGEAMWKPSDTSGDVVKVPRVDDNARRQGKRLTKSVKRECAYMLARLRQIVLGQQDTSIDDGCKKGRALSKRYLADTFASIQDFKRPDRAFRRTDEEDAPSTAAAVVIDESGSMGGMLQEAGMMAVALAQPLDALGCPVQVSGIRSTWYCNGGDARGCHRDYSVAYDVIKDWEEPFRAAEARFSKLQATGGTPLADGVEFALRGLQQREEDNRVMFVITDGEPDYNHRPVINRQIRLAREQGIHIIGVGIGYGAEYVEKLFDDSVWAERVSDLPKLLVKKLSAVMSGHRSGRSRRVA